MSCTTSQHHWLQNFVSKQSFFLPCPRCANQNSAREATLNFWDCEAQEELCSICVADAQRENVIQVGNLGFNLRVTVLLEQPHCLLSPMYLRSARLPWVLAPFFSPASNPFLLTRIKILFAGSSLIISRRRQSRGCGSISRHLKHPIIRHQRIKGALPPSKTTTTGTKGRCRRFPLHRL